MSDMAETAAVRRCRKCRAVSLDQNRRRAWLDRSEPSSPMRIRHGRRRCHDSHQALGKRGRICSWHHEPQRVAKQAEIAIVRMRCNRPKRRRGIVRVGAQGHRLAKRCAEGLQPVGLRGYPEKRSTREGLRHDRRNDEPSREHPAQPTPLPNNLAWLDVHLTDRQFGLHKLYTTAWPVLRRRHCNSGLSNSPRPELQLRSP
jgi:hypothetical protein